MAEYLLATLLLGVTAAVVAKESKKRNITLPVPAKELKKLKKMLRKSKFFKESDAMKIINIVQKRVSGEKDREEREEQKEIIKQITGTNSVPLSLPQAWCPNDEKTTCSLFDKDQYFPSDCIGDFNKLQCLDRINTYVADENKKSQLKDYCARVNDVCLTYESKQYATAQDHKKCGDLISGCN